MDKTNYKEMVETIINDNYDYYEKLASDPHKETIQKFNKCLKKHQDTFTEKELDYL